MRSPHYAEVKVIISVAVLSWALLLTTGCSGIELGGKLGMYRVDEKQESQRTYRHSVPLKCYFVNCDQPAEEASGS